MGGHDLIHHEAVDFHYYHYSLWRMTSPASSLAIKQKTVWSWSDLDSRSSLDFGRSRMSQQSRLKRGLKSQKKASRQAILFIEASSSDTWQFASGQTPKSGGWNGQKGQEDGPGARASSLQHLNLTLADATNHTGYSVHYYWLLLWQISIRYASTVYVYVNYEMGMSTPVPVRRVPSFTDLAVAVPVRTSDTARQETKKAPPPVRLS